MSDSDHDQGGDQASTAPQPPLLVQGERVGLGPLRRDLLPIYQRWINTLEVRRGLLNVRPSVPTLEAEEAWYERSAKAEDEANFTIYDLADMEPVGTTGLMHIDHYTGSAQFGIALGERRNQGLGTEATRLVLDYGFTVLGLHNVMLRVWSWNAGAVRAYEKAGFRLAGRLRGAAVSMGRRYDVTIMDATPEDLPKSVLTDLVPPGGQPRS